MPTSPPTAELVQGATTTAGPHAPVRRKTGRARVLPPAWLAYLVAVAALTTAYTAAHFAHLHWLNSGAVYNVIGGSTVVALIVGARRNTRRRRLPWYRRPGGGYQAPAQPQLAGHEAGPPAAGAARQRLA